MYNCLLKIRREAEAINYEIEIEKRKTGIDMKAWIVTEPNRSTVADIDLPIPKDDEVCIKVMTAGICGTDMHIFKGEYDGTYPIVPSHEFSGIVTDLGKNAYKFRIGQRVSADPNIYCENCIMCKENKQNFCLDFEALGVTRNGAFAQYLTIPERCVFDIFDIVFEDAAMIEPLSCVVYGQENLKISQGSSVLIFGAGSIGLLHLQISRLNGASNISIVDPISYKRDLAESLGANKTYSPKELELSDQKKKFDYVIDCTGIPSVIESSIGYLKNTGSLLIFGVAPENSSISIDPFEIFRRELKIIGSFALKKTFSKALEIIKNDRVNVSSLISDKLTLEELPDFFSGNVKKKETIKTIVILEQY